MTKINQRQQKMGPDSDHLQKEHDKHMTYKHMEYPYNFSNSNDHQPYLQGSPSPGTTLRLDPYNSTNTAQDTGCALLRSL